MMRTKWVLMVLWVFVATTLCCHDDELRVCNLQLSNCTSSSTILNLNDVNPFCDCLGNFGACLLNYTCLDTPTGLAFRHYCEQKRCGRFNCAPEAAREAPIHWKL